MTDVDNLPESQIEENPPDHRSYAPGWIAFSLGGAIFLIGSIGFVALYGIPGQGPGGTSPNQQQASGAPPPPPNAAPGGSGTRESTGYGAPATPRH